MGTHSHRTRELLGKLIFRISDTNRRQLRGNDNEKVSKSGRPGAWDSAGEWMHIIGLSALGPGKLKSNSEKKVQHWAIKTNGLAAKCRPTKPSLAKRQMRRWLGALTQCVDTLLGTPENSSPLTDTKIQVMLRYRYRCDDNLSVQQIADVRERANRTWIGWQNLQILKNLQIRKKKWEKKEKRLCNSQTFV